MTIRRYGFAALAGFLTLGGLWLPAPLPAVAAESYFCIELVLSRNWPAARFYCDAMASRDNTGTVLAEGIAYFFSADNATDVSHAARLWRGIPPLADNTEWRNVSGVFDQEINTIERKAATLDRLAQYMLGVLHETGHLSPPDPAAAVFRYQQAANAGVPEAHIALARLYQQGIGVEADPVTAEQHVLAAIEARPARVRPAPEVEPEEADAEEALVAEANTTVDGDGATDDGATDDGATDDGATDDVTEAIDVAEATETVDDAAANAPAADPLEETFVIGRSVPNPTLDAAVPDTIGQVDGEVASADPQIELAVTDEVVAQHGEAAADDELAPTSLVRIITVTPQPNVSLREVPGSTPLPAAQPDASVFDSLAEELPPTVVDDPMTPAIPVVQLWDSDSGVAIVAPSTSTTVDRSVPSEGIETDAADGVAPSSDPSIEAVLLEDEIGDGDSSSAKWEPPPEVAALYYPKESLEDGSGDLEQGSNGGIREGVVAAGEADLSVAAGRVDTREPVDQSTLSCADPDSGATMAMPVIREDGDQNDPQSEDGLRFGTPLEDDDLAAIERGIRAKAAGDVDGALQAWQPLAEAGVPTAQYLVGLLYLTGDAVPRNLRLAYAWFSLAAANGHQLANCERYRLSQRLSADDVALADDLADDLVGVP